MPKKKKKKTKIRKKNSKKLKSKSKNKKKSSIIKKQENETAALNFLEKKFDGLKTKNIKILYDMAGIYKSFEKYDEAIKIYSKLLDLLDNRSKAYADILLSLIHI